MSNSYSVSLQAWHPNAEPESLIEGIGMLPKLFWKVGDQRKTAKGSILRGSRHESYCLFELEDGNGRELSEYLADILCSLSACADFIWKLRQTGGRVSFFVLWQPGDHRGDSFGVDLLSEMAGIGIDLGIEPVF